MGRDIYSSRKTVEETKSISTVYLNENNLLKRGLRNMTITWTGGWRAGEESIGLQVLMLENDEYVRFQYTQTDDYTGKASKLDYKVRLVSTPCNFGGYRWWFICPLVSDGNACGRRVAVLYRGGKKYFGCRHCYNLTYECQRQRYEKYFEELGVDPKVARNVLKHRRKFCKTENT